MATPALVPYPASVRALAEAPLRLDARAVVTGPSVAAAALADLVLARTGLALSCVESETVEGTIRLTVAGKGAPESFRISVSAASAVVEGADDAGLFYGVQTLVQLLSHDEEGWMLPSVEIADAPRFSYRGVMLDVARHFFDVDTVKAWIDRASSLKFNHLHLHLSDDQGWRLAIDSRPELTARAAATAVGDRDGGYYTKADFADIVEHASARHMVVVPEFDVPGHTHAVGLAYPEIAAPPVVTDAVRETTETFGGELPAAGEPYRGVAVGFSSLRIGTPETEAFLRDVFTELAQLTPGPYVHLGGDEAHGTDPSDYAEFVRLAVAIVAATGKTPMAWHEVGAVSGLPAPLIGQYWGFVTPEEAQGAAARAIVDAGGSIVLSPADAIYLDMKPRAEAPLGLTWANGPTSPERAYDWEPADVLPGVPAAALRGVEAPLWTETAATLADLDALAFPRIAAAAEIAWSPARGESPERNWPSFRDRVVRLSSLWAARGIGFDREAVGAEAAR